MVESCTTALLFKLLEIIVTTVSRHFTRSLLVRAGRNLSFHVAIVFLTTLFLHGMVETYCTVASEDGGHIPSS
jgi:hypothetical protein